MKHLFKTAFLALFILTAISSVSLAAPAKAVKPANQVMDSSLKGTVNINTATAAQLTMLPGIGDKIAKRIVEYRTKAGGFKSLEDLKKVNGIGNKKFSKIKPFCSLQGQTSLIKK